jgi:hypothetical protein
MSSPTDNVSALREAGVIPPEVQLKKEQEKAINDLSQQEIATVLSVHSKVGTIEHRYEGPYKMFIF